MLETPIFERHLVGPDERQHPDHQKPTWENVFSCKEYLVFFEKPAPYKINSLASHYRATLGIWGAESDGASHSLVIVASAVDYPSSESAGSESVAPLLIDGHMVARATLPAQRYPQAAAAAVNASASAAVLAQRLQNPLIKEYALNYNRIPNMIYGIYSLIKGFWSLWGPANTWVGQTSAATLPCWVQKWGGDCGCPRLSGLLRGS